MNDNISVEEKKRIISEHFQVNMDRWASLVEPHETILTISFPLTVEEGRAMLRKNHHYIKEHPEIEQLTNDSLLIERLKEKIGVYMLKVNEKFNNDEKGANKKTSFVKLSSRSPKDVTMGDYFKTLVIYDNLANKQENVEFLAAHVDNIDENKPKGGSKVYTKNEQLVFNEKLKWLYQASTEAMKTENEEEALDLLLQSRRIYWDLQYALEFPESFDIQIIFREWRKIPLQFEFRAFVYNNQLTAISQYFTQLFFPTLSKDFILQKIKPFWEGLKDRLAILFAEGELVKYVIDFAFVVDDGKKDEEGEVVVLELNPYNISTGSGLFNWEEERDCDVLEGIKPFEFRSVAQPLAHSLRNKLHPHWVSLLFGN